MKVMMNSSKKAIGLLASLLLLAGCAQSTSFTGTVNCDPQDAQGITTCRATPAPTATQTPSPTQTATPTPTPTETTPPVPVTASYNDTPAGTGVNQFAYTGTWLTSTAAGAYKGD